MTSQEQQWLDDFLQRLAAVRGVAKDPQADALIHQRLADQPDASYLLVQRALLLERALDGAKQQIAQLQQAAAQRPDAGGASFLGGANNGLEPGFGRAPAAPGLYPAQVVASQAVPPPQAAPGWRERLFGSAPQAAPAGGPGFLGTAASAAAGVAGGMFLFNGLESLLGQHHASSNGLFSAGGLGDVSSPSLAQPPAMVENITQNYYGSDFGNDRGGQIDSGGSLRDDSGGNSDWDTGVSDVADAGSFFDDDLLT